MHIQKKFNILFSRKGTCNRERLLPELVDNHLLVNDKNLSDHLRFLYLYTDLLAYYDINDKPIKGNIWRKFLEQDRTVIRSLILHTHVDKFKKNMHTHLVALRCNHTSIEDLEHINNILVLAKELIILFNYWYKNLANEDAVRVKLATIIHEVLNVHLNKLYKILQQYHSNHAIASIADFCSFIKEQCQRAFLWELKEAFLSTELPKSSFNEVKAHDVMDTMENFFDAAFQTIYQLQALVRIDYLDTLYTQDKEPHMALLIAFLQLLQCADEHLNHIPQRFLDHYYRHILKFNNSPSIPDRAYVHFMLNPSYEFAFVPEGSRLVAKNPFNGGDIFFETQRRITVNQAKISQINVLSIQAKINKEGTSMAELATETYSSQELSAGPRPLFPLYSDNKDTLSIPQFALLIGSPLFYLAEGRRTIHLKWQFTVPSFQALISKSSNQTAAFLAKLANYFHARSYVHITTQAGWFPIPEEAITVAFIEASRCLHMTLSLSTETPPIGKLPPDYKDSRIANPHTPALYVATRDQLLPNSFYFLNSLIVERVDLKVSVEEYRGLVLQNRLGIIDNSQIIEPFGPLPKPDGSFYIGSGEVFSKNLTDLKINIQWDHVPSIEGGFRGYYKAYPTSVGNEDFKVNISYLNHQHWNPFYAQNRQSVPLFQVVKSKQGNEQLDTLRIIDNINIYALGISKRNEPLDVVCYGPQTTAGFLKLKLNVPQQAFGHAIYPSLMSNLLVKQAQQKKRGEAPIVLNEPYTPRIKSITLDYEAEESIIFTTFPSEEEKKYANSLFHISPFGYANIFPRALNKPITLFPLIQEAEVSIAFGIKDLNSTSFSMHIAIDENSPHADKPEVSKPIWSYLSDDLWLPLEEAIVVDGTNGCRQSGIITIDLEKLPNKATIHNTYMTTGLIWMSIQFIGAMEGLAPIIGVYTQAVAVARVMDEHGVFSSPILPPKAIGQFQNALEGIEAVVQPFPTFGGKQFENHQAFYRRVSERLRHKNRAISVWDYERIILEKFPEIFRVKCINHAAKSLQSITQPGCITLVVVAKKRDPTHRFPIVSKRLLNEIHAYIQTVSAPFIQFEVVNPVYEDIKVNVAVKFKVGYERGLFLNLLQQALKNFLSPWLLDQSADIPIGGDIPTSKVIDFINSCAYVEGIGNFSIFKYVGKAPNLKLDKVTSYDSHLWATYPWSVMVSSENHKISVVDKFDAVVRLRHGCIGDMAIGEDFIIGPLESPPDTPVVGQDEGIPMPSSENYCLITPKKISADYGNY